MRFTFDWWASPREFTNMGLVDVPFWDEPEQGPTLFADVAAAPARTANFPFPTLDKPAVGLESNIEATITVRPVTGQA